MTEETAILNTKRTFTSEGSRSIWLDATFTGSRQRGLVSGSGFQTGKRNISSLPWPWLGPRVSSRGVRGNNVQLASQESGVKEHRSGRRD